MTSSPQVVTPTTDPLTALRAHAADPQLRRVLTHQPLDRTWARVPTAGDVELWLISWPVGAATGWHDHGVSAGAFTVLEGELLEHSWAGGLHIQRLGAGDERPFGADHIHDVRNCGDVPALSLHAYSPRLETMTRYRFWGDRVEALGVERAGAQW